MKFDEGKIYIKSEDTEKEIDFLQSKLQEHGINMSLVEAWAKGGEGATDIAEKIVKKYIANYKK